MRISILGSRGFADNRLVSATMEDFICETQCYLFTVVCGNTEKKLSESIMKMKMNGKHGKVIKIGGK